MSQYFPSDVSFKSFMLHLNFTFAIFFTTVYSLFKKLLMQDLKTIILIVSVFSRFNYLHFFFKSVCIGLIGLI